MILDPDDPGPIPTTPVLAKPDRINARGEVVGPRPSDTKAIPMAGPKARLVVVRCELCGTPNVVGQADVAQVLTSYRDTMDAMATMIGALQKQIVALEMFAASKKESDG